MKNIYRSVFLALTLNVILISNSAIAQTNFWEQTKGPFSGSVNSIVFTSSGNCFVGTGDRGIYTSKDNGKTWMRTSTMATVNIVYNSRKILFTALRYRGIYRSTDDGNSWEEISNGFGYLDYQSMKKNERGDVFISCGSENKLIYSTNDGLNWNSFITDPPKKYIMDFDIQNNTIFVATRDSGIFKTTDQGKNWTHIGLDRKQLMLITMHPHGDIFASSYNNQLFHSSDFGQTWKDIAPIFDRVSCIAFRRNGDILLGYEHSGLYISTDFGIQWQKLVSPDSEIDIITFDSSDAVWVSTNNAIYKTDDLKKWNSLGFANTKIACLTVNSKGYLFAGGFGNHMSCSGDHCIFRSTDRGDSWYHIMDSLEFNFVYHLCVNSKDELFAATRYCTDTYGGWIARSTNDGLTWNKTGFINATEKINIGEYLIVDSNDSLYTTIVNQSIYRSGNSGMTWSKIKDKESYGSRNPIAIDLNDNIFSFYMIPGKRGIVRSTDYGKTWIRLDTLQNRYSQILYADRHGDLFMGGDGVSRSSDGGYTWVQYQLGVGDATAITSNNIGELYIGFSDGTVYCSKDDGISWKVIGDSLIRYPIKELICDNLGYLYAATDGGGVYRSVRSTTSVKEISIDAPSFLSLDQIYPNPLQRNSTIQFSLPSSGNVTLKIYDVLGKEVETLVNEYREAGKYSVGWNVMNKPSGMYFCRLTMNNNSVTKTIMLLK